MLFRVEASSPDLVKKYCLNLSCESNAFQGAKGLAEAEAKDKS